MVVLNSDAILRSNNRRSYQRGAGLTSNAHGKHKNTNILSSFKKTQTYRIPF